MFTTLPFHPAPLSIFTIFPSPSRHSSIIYNLFTLAQPKLSCLVFTLRRVIDFFHCVPYSNIRIIGFNSITLLTSRLLSMLLRMSA